MLHFTDFVAPLQYRWAFSWAGMNTSFESKSKSKPQNHWENPRTCNQLYYDWINQMVNHPSLLSWWFSRWTACVKAVLKHLNNVLISKYKTKNKGQFIVVSCSATLMTCDCFKSAEAFLGWGVSCSLTYSMSLFVRYYWDFLTKWKRSFYLLLANINMHEKAFLVFSCLFLFS